MIARIKDFFSQFIEPGTQPGAHMHASGSEHALQVATAALLLEMMRMDDRITEVERQSITRTLQGHFSLDTDQLDTLLALAEQEAREARGYYEFTSLINKACDATQKVRIVEYLWQVAFVDGHLDAHELHLMRKITDLLHVSHADNAAAKQRARETTGVPPAP